MDTGLELALFPKLIQLSKDESTLHDSLELALFPKLIQFICAKTLVHKKS